MLEIFAIALFTALAILLCVGATAIILVRYAGDPDDDVYPYS